MLAMTTRDKINTILNGRDARLTADELIGELERWAENGPDDMSKGEQLILRLAADRLKLYRSERRANAHNLNHHEPDCDYWCDQYERECSCGIRQTAAENAIF